jgi:hypothetical protein
MQFPDIRAKALITIFFNEKVKKSTESECGTQTHRLCFKCSIRAFEKHCDQCPTIMSGKHGESKWFFRKKLKLLIDSIVSFFIFFHSSRQLDGILFAFADSLSALYLIILKFSKLRSHAGFGHR